MSGSAVERSVVGYECKHAVYIPAIDGSPNDLLSVKEYVHYSDGTKEPKLRLIHNFKRPFWITKESFQKHNDKKEWELLSRLRRFESTQIQLVQNIQKALGKPPSRISLRMAARSPYVYGADITTPVLTKQHYLEKWPNCISDNSVAVVDSETDMVEGHEEIIMLSITMRSKAKIFVVEDFMRGTHNPEEAIRKACQKYLGKYLEARRIELEVVFVKNAGECTLRTIQTAHLWKPDILAIWNVNYDFPKMLSALEKYGYNPADVFSDPSIPREFRHFEYIEGAAQQITASGKSRALHPAERWHVAVCPATFYVLDAMCVYLKLRIAAGKEASYSLDAILRKHLGVHKLHFDEADHLSGGKWHSFMQKNYKPEYCAYNLFDCISMELLDENTTDLTRLISLMCGPSEYHRFPSQPRRTCDDLHFLALENDRVIATTSDKMEVDLELHLPNLKGWIVTLPSHNVFDSGLKAIEELPDVSTNIYGHVADEDVEGTYPNVQVLCNISKETTAKELCRIAGLSESDQRSIGINLSGGHVNAVETAVRLYNAPTFDELLDGFVGREVQRPTRKAVTFEYADIEGETDDSEA